jgi:hypothetical protein
MIKRFSVAVMVLVVAVGVTAGLAAATAMSWGKAVDQPGMAALNTGHLAETSSIACPSARNCSAGGYYQQGSVYHGWVASEKSGVWGKALKDPGLKNLNAGNSSVVDAISCGGVGACTAGGWYRDKYGYDQAFVVSQKKGVWGIAKEVVLPNLFSAAVTSLSCRSVGNCSAGGYYDDHSGLQAFVVSEKNGVWGAGIEVPGTETLNAGGNANTVSVSCGSAGNCAAGGSYYDSTLHQHAWAATETKNVWGKAVEVPGIAALNAGGFAQVSAVSCATAGNCTAGGYYWDKNNTQQAFLVSAKGGKWGSAFEVKGMKTLDLGGRAEVSSVSCVASKASPSNCAVGGFYSDVHGYQQAYVASEKNGVWGDAKALTLANYGYASVTAVSCSQAGNCAAVGYYADAGGYQQAFVAGENNSAWSPAVEVPGTAALNHGAAAANVVSCVGANTCSIGGWYGLAVSGREAWVTSP